MHVRLRNWLRSCSRRGTIPIHDIADFTYGSQLLKSIPNKFPSDSSVDSRRFPYGSPGLSNRTLLLATWPHEPLDAPSYVGGLSFTTIDFEQ